MQNASCSSNATMPALSENTESSQGFFSCEVVPAMVVFPLLYLWSQSSPKVLDDPQFESGPMLWYCWVSYGAFGISYAWLTRGLGTRRPDVFDLL